MARLFVKVKVPSKMGAHGGIHINGSIDAKCRDFVAEFLYPPRVAALFAQFGQGAESKALFFSCHFVQVLFVSKYQKAAVLAC